MIVNDNVDITRLLHKARSGKKDTLDLLYPLLYDHLRTIAQKHIALERNGHTIQKTSLVHELYLKLVHQSEVEWKDRVHFFSLASRCMRQVLVDYARKKNAEKRGGKNRAITLDEDRLMMEEHAGNLIEINDLTEKLAQLDERRSKVVEMRFFGGMTNSEIAEVLNVTTRTVDRDWAKAKLWLANEMRNS